jgi:hypothetical protein
VPNAETLSPTTRAVVHLFDQRAAEWRSLCGGMGRWGKMGCKSLAGVGTRIKIDSIGTIGITLPGSGVPHEQRLVQSSGNDRDSGCLRWSRMRQYRAPAIAAPGASGPADVRYFVGGAGGGGGGRGGFPVPGPPASGATIGAARTRERAGPLSACLRWFHGGGGWSSQFSRSPRGVCDGGRRGPAAARPVGRSDTGRVQAHPDECGSARASPAT